MGILARTLDLPNGDTVQIVPSNLWRRILAALATAQGVYMEAGCDLDGPDWLPREMAGPLYAQVRTILLELETHRQAVANTRTPRGFVTGRALTGGQDMG